MNYHISMIIPSRSQTVIAPGNSFTQRCSAILPSLFGIPPSIQGDEDRFPWLVVECTTDVPMALGIFKQEDIARTKTTRDMQAQLGDLGLLPNGQSCQKKTCQKKT